VIQAPERMGMTMSNPFRLTDAQMARLRPFFPKSHGVPRDLHCSQRHAVVRFPEGVAQEGAVPKTVMIDATCLKAHRTASSLRSKRGARRPAGPSDRSNQGRHEHEAARGHRYRWSPDPVLHDRRPGQRLHRSGGPDGLPGYHCQAQGKLAPIPYRIHRRAAG
jgi:hypothetical protein